MSTYYRSMAVTLSEVAMEMSSGSVWMCSLHSLGMMVFDCQSQINKLNYC